MAAGVKPKKRCCTDRPRCKRCPLVLCRLERAGYAEREDGRFLVAVKVPKRVMRAARA